MSQPRIGRLRLYYPTLGSTNDLARQLAQAGYPHGVIVIADHQTAGRGRQGRRWEAPPGTALLCSTIVRPRLATEAAPRLVMAAALATADAVAAITGLEACLKWPNDVLLPVTSDPSLGYALRKVAGLLVESLLVGARLEAAIVGIGINISAHPVALGTATDLATASGRSIARADLLDSLAAQLDAWLERLDEGDGQHLFHTWRERLITLGQPVQVTTPSEDYAAVALDVAMNGALVVRTARGEQRHLHAGDVTLSHSRAT